MSPFDEAMILTAFTLLSGVRRGKVPTAQHFWTRPRAVWRGRGLRVATGRP